MRRLRSHNITGTGRGKDREICYAWTRVEPDMRRSDTVIMYMNVYEYTIFTQPEFHKENTIISLNIHMTKTYFLDCRRIVEQLFVKRFNIICQKLFIKGLEVVLSIAV